MAGLKRQASITEVTDKVINGMRMIVNKKANLLQLSFGGKPTDEIRRNSKPEISAGRLGNEAK